MTTWAQPHMTWRHEATIGSTLGLSKVVTGALNLRNEAQWSSGSSANERVPSILHRSELSFATLETSERHHEGSGHLWPPATWVNPIDPCGWPQVVVGALNLHDDPQRSPGYASIK